MLLGASTLLLELLVRSNGADACAVEVDKEADEIPCELTAGVKLCISPIDVDITWTGPMEVMD